MSSVSAAPSIVTPAIASAATSVRRRVVMRRLYRLLVPQRLDRIDVRGTECRNRRREDTRDHDARQTPYVRQGIEHMHDAADLCRGGGRHQPDRQRSGQPGAGEYTEPDRAY